MSRQAQGCREPGAGSAEIERAPEGHWSQHQKKRASLSLPAALRGAQAPFPPQHVSLPPRSNFLSIVPSAGRLRAVRPASPPRHSPAHLLPTLHSPLQLLGARPCPQPCPQPARGAGTGARPPRLWSCSRPPREMSQPMGRTLGGSRYRGAPCSPTHMPQAPCGRHRSQSRHAAAGLLPVFVFCTCCSPGGCWKSLCE